MELEDPMLLGLWHWNIFLPIASWAKCDDNEVYEVGAGDTLLFSGGQICISWINPLLSGSSIFKKNFCTIDQNADYLLNKIMTYLFYGIKKEKREREEIHFHTQKKYNWQMQREDLMFSQYIVWYERNYARTML